MYLTSSLAWVIHVVSPFSILVHTYVSPDVKNFKHTKEEWGGLH